MQKALNRQCKSPHPHPHPSPAGAVGTVRTALSLTSFSTVKADKKAAQEKMIQQEHERQVRPAGRRGGALVQWGAPVQ